MQSQKSRFTGHQFTAEMILWAVRWYLQFPISYRDLELMLRDLGVSVDHTTVFRWIQPYALDETGRIQARCRHDLRTATCSCDKPVQGFAVARLAATDAANLPSYGA